MERRKERKKKWEGERGERAVLTASGSDYSCGVNIDEVNERVFFFVVYIFCGCREIGLGRICRD